MQLLCILLAASRVHTVNFQAFLASDKFPICLVTVFVFVFFNICICVVRYLYYLDILAVHALLGNKHQIKHQSSAASQFGVKDRSGSLAIFPKTGTLCGIHNKHALGIMARYHGHHAKPSPSLISPAAAAGSKCSVVTVSQSQQ